MKILVAGDSWSQGEWGFQTGRNAVDHSGLAHYLSEDGHDVTNVGQGACTNELQVEWIENATKEQNYDYIFWFHSTFERQLVSNRHRNLLETSWPFIEQWHKDNKNIWDNINTLDDFLNLEKQMVDNVYDRLNKINQTVHVIGGSSKVSPSISNYKNLVTVFDCVSEWLLPNFKFPRWVNSQLDYTKFTSKDEALLNFLLEDKNKLVNILNNLPRFGHADQAATTNPNQELMEYLWPDGNHMNRQGHFKLHKYIKEKIL